MAYGDWQLRWECHCFVKSLYWTSLISLFQVLISQMWGQMSNTRPNKETMLSFLKEHNIVLPETASISQIRTAYEAMAIAVDNLDGQALGSAQHHSDGPPDGDGHADASRIVERGEEEVICEQKRIDIVATGSAQCTDGVEKGGKIKSLERELELARIKMEMLQLQLRIEGAKEKQGDNNIKIRLTEISGIVGEFSGVSGTNTTKWLRLLESTIVSFGGGHQECYKLGRALLSGSARQHANKEMWCDWKTMHDGLLNLFPERRSAMDVYEDLKKRSRKAGESSEEYVLAMEEIADDLITEADLIPLVIVGLCRLQPSYDSIT